MSLEQTVPALRTDEPPTGQWLAAHIGPLIQAIEPTYFTSKRWFGSKSRQLKSYQPVDFVLLSEAPTLLASVILQIEYSEGEPELYHLPLALGQADHAPALIREQAGSVAGRVQTGQGDFYLYDAFADEEFCRLLYQNMFDNRQLPSQKGTFRFEAVQNRLSSREFTSVKRISTEQSNTSIIYNQELILKAFRKLSAGQNPDFEVPFFLTTYTDFKFVPKVAGFIEYRSANAQLYSIGALQDFVANDGDGYNFTLDSLRDYFEQIGVSASDASRVAEYAGTYPTLAGRLGQITGLLHNSLASNSELPEFAPELISADDVKGWQTSISALINKVCDNIRAQLDRHPPAQRQGLETILAHQADYLKLVDDLAVLTEDRTYKTRYHGDYHLGQVLKTGGDFVILDFEGEPARSLAERRAKHSPLKDVAGMIRSFNYAAYAGLFEAQKANSAPDLEQWATDWERLAVRDFEVGYQEAVGHNQGATFLPASDEIRTRALNVFLLEKAFYELNYEFNNRPDWVPIPLKGILRIIGQG